MINVTKTYLPPIERYTALLHEVWESGQLTNGGPLCDRLERELAQLLGVQHLVLVSNGTLALQIAQRAVGFGKQVLTTPFSYVATTSSLVWEGRDPVFVDIDPESLCIDAEGVREAVSNGQRADGILATHVYGNPCAVQELAEIARANEIPLLYDAAHAFGVRFQDRSILTFGDASVLSFHATKLFHTAEGGAIVTSRDDVAHLSRQFRNFGHVTPETFDVVGINAKMSELHAAMGLAVLPDMGNILEARRRCSERYDQILSHRVERPRWAPGTERNYAYYPILLRTSLEREEVIDVLQSRQVLPRRYFSPALNSLPYVSSSPMPVAQDAADRVLCLPLSASLAMRDVDFIAAAVLSVIADS